MQHSLLGERLPLIGKKLLRYIITPFKKNLVGLNTMLIEPINEMKYKNKIKVYNGVRYKSMLEVTCATLLTQNNVEFQYEPFEMVLVEGSKYPGQLYEKQLKKKVRTYGPARGNIRSISYTPDFVGDNWIIETKGYETPEFKLKWKLFQHELMKQHKTPHLFKPTNKREIIESINIIKSLKNVETKNSRGPHKRTKGLAKKG